MRFLFLFSILISSRAFCLEGSTYFVRQSFVVPAGAVCSQDLDSISKILFGAQDEFRGAVPYAFVRCVTGDDRPLQVEVLFEPVSEAGRQALEDHMRVLEASAWRGEALRVQYVGSIFWNLYGAAVGSKGELLSGFEKPRVAKSFDEILIFKSELKAATVGPAAGFVDFLSQQMSARDLASWKKDVLGRARQVDFSVYLYFLTDDDLAEKSTVSYQLSRVCSAAACL